MVMKEIWYYIPAAIIIFLTTFILLFWYGTRHFNYWHKKGVPYFKPLPFIGNLKEVVTFQKCIGIHLRDMYNSVKGLPYKGMFIYDQPVLMVRDLDIIKDILHQNFHHFVDKGLTLTSHDKLLGDALFCIKGQRWRTIRHQLSPGFSTKKLKNMYHLVNEKAKMLDTYFCDEAISGMPLPTRDILGRFTTDIVASVGFGIECNSLENPNTEFRKYLKFAFLYSKVGALKLIGAFVDLPLFHIFPITTATKRGVKFFQKIVWDTIQHRKKTNTINVRNDYLDHLMQILDKQDAAQNCKEEQFPAKIDVVSQAFTFLSAGFETTSSTILYTLYHLALDRAIQDRLRSEIKEAVVKNDGKITYETIQYLPYLDMVISETLRMYPTMSFLDRTCTQPYIIPGTDILIDKGVLVFTSLIGIQRDPDLYPDPERYDPERFSDDKKNKRHKCAYMPFGDGQRICIGKRFGVMVVKNALSHLLLNYEVLPCSKTPKTLQFDVHSFLLTVSHEVPLVFMRI